MAKSSPHNRKNPDLDRLEVFLRNPVNDSVHPEDAQGLPLPRNVTDNFQRWSVAVIRSMATQVRNLKILAAAKDKAIAKRDEEIADLKFRLSEADARADRDGLTGLFNKAYFMRELYAIHQDNVAGNDRRTRTADMIVMIDLDGFKPINDNYGHAAGDRALCAVAEFLKAGVRDTDTVARLGGDEFALILRGADEGAAQQKVRQFTEGFKTLSFAWEDAVIAVRGSVGSSPIDWQKSPEDNLAMADKVMYGIKSAKGDMRFTLHVV